MRSRLIHSLDRWYFEPHRLPDEEVLACTLLLFEALFRIEGMREAVPLTMRLCLLQHRLDVSHLTPPLTEQMSDFIHHLRRIYRYENSYHNFEHALDVLQAAQSYLKSEGMVPSPTILFDPTRMWKPKKQFDSGSLISTLGLRQLFILYIAAIGHDVGHPGFSNVFMVNSYFASSFHKFSLNKTHTTLLEKRADAPISCFQSSISAGELALSVATASDEISWFRCIIGQFVRWTLPQEDTVTFGASDGYGCTSRFHASIQTNVGWRIYFTMCKADPHL